MALTFAHQGLAISFDQSYGITEALDHFTQMRDQARVARSKQLEAYALIGIGSMTANLGDVPGGERSLTNVARHAQASRVRVAVERLPDS